MQLPSGASPPSESRRPEDILEKGRRLLGAGAVEDAIAELRRVVRQHPDHAEAHLLLGKALALVEMPSDAVAALQRAVELRPDSAHTHYTLGTALARFGDTAGARPKFERALELDPRLSEAHVGLALILAQQKDLALARSHLALAIGQQGESRKAAYSHYLMAQVLREQREPEKALEHLAAAIARRPRYAEAYLSRGVIQQERLDDGAALESFRTAVRLAPDDAAAQAKLGAAYLRARKAEQAIPHLERALQIRPTERATRYHLCRAFRVAGRTAEADACAQKVAERLEQRAAGDVAAGVANDDGIELEAAGNLAAALERYRAAVDLDPFNTLFRRNFALALCRLGRWAEGVAEFEKVLEADPNDQDATRALYVAKEQARKQKQP